MEQAYQQQPKIKFYAVRTFGEKLNATFDFIKQNWKPVLKFSTYLILPLCIVQSFFLAKFVAAMSIITAQSAMAQSEVMTSEMTRYFINAGVFTLFTMVGTLLITAALYGLIQLYNERSNGLQGVTLKDLKPHLFRNLKRCLITILLGFILFALVAFIMGILAAMAPVTLAFTMPLLFVLCVPLALLTPIYLFEHISFWKALAKTFRLGFATWIGIVGMGIVMILIINILSGVMSLPLFVGQMIQLIFSMSEESISNSAAFNIMQYFWGILSTYGTYISMLFGVVGLSYQYAHANEKLNSVSVVEEIDNFEQF